MALTPPCVIVDSSQNRELVDHGTALFPLACYEENLTCFRVPWHWHEDFEYIIAAEGRVTVGVNKTRLCLEQGQGVFINSGVLHCVEMAEAGPSVLHSGVFHPRLAGGMDTVFWQKFTAPILAADSPQYFLLDGSEPWHGDALASLHEAWEAIEAETAGCENTARYKITGVMSLLAANRPARAGHLSRQEREEAARMKQMLRFIEENYAGEISARAIAAAAAVSESACLRSFKRMLNTTPIQYLKQYRVEKAAQLLLTTGVKAGEAGAECGFADMSYFTRTFKEIKGCTPAEYRRRFGKQ